MSDYIDRQAAINSIRGMEDVYVNNLPPMICKEEARMELVKLPPSDVVEVVRCWNCVWWDTCPSSTIAPTFHRCKRVGCMSMPGDGFCSYGERKDG